MPKRLIHCVMCHRRLERRQRIFCSRACSMRAYRRRKAGVPEEFGIARRPRGSISLAQSYERVQRRNLLDSVRPPL